MSLLQKLNNAYKFTDKETIKIRELIEETDYEVNNVRRTRNVYNEKFGAIQIESEDFITYLPNIYAKIIDDSNIKEMKKRGNFYFIYTTVDKNKNYIDIMLTKEKKKKAK